jgi:Ca2+-transporting ATPase
MGFFTNKMLTLAMFGSLLLQLAVLTVPFLQGIFKVAPMGLEQWLIVLGLSLSIIPIVEIQKIFLRLGKKG